ncbi:galanin receptor 2a-like [Patiria miniata]|uniref:G-protein coupled receptors family 1 profile domain-containing protein n=1 Tax=Patiria miniata TaxID=46514 RepID=A0A913ZIH1_PATMI|nr:galanin receptor 2a-like [Patiria miniata]
METVAWTDGVMSREPMEANMTGTTTPWDVSTEATDGEMLEGPAALSGSELASVIIYWTIGSLGVIGNTLVCIIFRVLKQRRSQVNLYILNQAFADLVTALLLIAFGTTRVYRSDIPLVGAQGVFLCRLWWSRFFLFSGFAVSAHNLTLMSFERYIAVVHPLRYGKLFTPRFTKLTIVLVWLIAPIMQYIFPIFQRSLTDGKCTFQSTWTPIAGSAVGVCLFVWEYFLPCVIMSYAYITIVWTLKQKEKALTASTQSQTVPTVSGGNRAPSKAAYSRRRNVTITLLTVFVVYVLCWTPNQFTFLQFNLGGSVNFDGAWYLFTVAAAFINSCANPFVYALMHKQFQAGLKLIIRCRRRGRAIMDGSLTDRSTMGTVVD